MTCEVTTSRKVGISVAKTETRCSTRSLNYSHIFHVDPCVPLKTVRLDYQTESY